MTRNTKKYPDHVRRRRDILKRLLEHQDQSSNMRVVALAPDLDTPGQIPIVEIAHELHATWRQGEIKLEPSQLSLVRRLIAGPNYDTVVSVRDLIFRPTPKLNAESLANRLRYIAQSVQVNRRSRQASAT